VEHHPAQGAALQLGSCRRLVSMTSTQYSD
jgi:hypothetical protein